MTAGRIRKIKIVEFENWHNIAICLKDTIQNLLSSYNSSFKDTQDFTVVITRNLGMIMCFILMMNLDCPKDLVQFLTVFLFNQ